MRIYAVADIHGKKDKFSWIYRAIEQFTPDILVAAGDMTNYLNWKKPLARLDSLTVPVLAVRGNSDFKVMDKTINRARNLTLLGPVPIKIRGVLFAGANGALPLPFCTRINFREKRTLEAMASSITTDTILVVHPPPRGVCDRAGSRFSVGSTNLAKFIRTTQPDMVLCGHIHEQAGFGMIGSTKILNCAMTENHLGALIDIEKKRVARVICLHPRGTSDIKAKFVYP